VQQLILILITRDGFFFSRPPAGTPGAGVHLDPRRRTPFMAIDPSQQPASWRYGCLLTAGGPAIINDTLYFYGSGSTGSIPGGQNVGPHNWTQSTGVATLRRDVRPPGCPRHAHHHMPARSLWTACFKFQALPVPVPRIRLQGFVAVSAAHDTATLTTRQLRFRGDHLFVNVEAVVPTARLRVAVEDASRGTALPGYSLADAVPLVGTNSTIAQVSWRAAPTLPVAARAPATVRLSFEMTAGMRLYAFWVAPTSAGHSGGYVGRGGPSFSTLRDVETSIKTDDLQLQSTNCSLAEAQCAPRTLFSPAYGHGSSYPRTVYAEHFGSATDDWGARINSAVQATELSTTVVLPLGTFELSEPIKIWRLRNDTEGVDTRAKNISLAKLGDVWASITGGTPADTANGLTIEGQGGGGIPGQLSTVLTWKGSPEQVMIDLVRATFVRFFTDDIITKKKKGTRTTPP
jgi:hypothetical protein